MKRIGAIAVCMSFSAPAAALTLEDLQGASIQTRVNYDMRVRRPQGTFDTQMVMLWNFKIDEEGRVRGQMTRTVTTPRGPRTRTTPMGGRIGKPGDAVTGGQGLWVLEGDKLVLLRAFDAGGFKAEITFSGDGQQRKCSIRAPFLKEEGASNIRTSTSVVGGPVTVLAATQRASDCKITR